MSLAAESRPDIDRPRYDQSTFMGRALHFVTITDPRNILATGAQLDAAKKIVDDYRSDKVPGDLTVEDLWKAKNVYDSAYHPDTKEKMLVVGRMSAQVPCNMLITGCMMTFYKTTPAVVFWQWMNQSFNALVNYTNRSGDKPIPVQQLGMSYVAATGGALFTALSLNNLVKSAPPLIGRFVPWCAVAAANCINIPLMRRQELSTGITVVDEKGRKLGESPAVAKVAIGKVVFSRVFMATPGMGVTPLIMNYLDKKPWFSTRPFLAAPVQVGIVGFMLAFATPLCCALFPQMSSMSVTGLEPELQAKIAAMPNPPSVVYYNKGL